MFQEFFKFGILLGILSGNVAENKFVLNWNISTSSRSTVGWMVFFNLNMKPLNLWSTNEGRVRGMGLESKGVIPHRSFHPLCSYPKMEPIVGPHRKSHYLRNKNKQDILAISRKYIFDILRILMSAWKYLFTTFHLPCVWRNVY